MNKSIHVISFDVPYPANYGGVIDVYNRVKTLSENGANIILHCFEYGRGEQKQLNKVADQVYYYNRSKNPFLLLNKNPFIIESRRNNELLKNLLHDDFAILFEGHHTCAFLNHPQLEKRKKLVRAHNIEHEYYEELAKAEKNFFKKIFFKLEAKKLKRFEPKLRFADSILTVSLKEQKHFQEKYKNAIYLSVFNPLSIGTFNNNKEKCILFHGNLSVAENDRACHFLIDEVFKNKEWLFKIAGFKPNQSLISKCADKSNVELINSPTDEHLHSLISSSQINLLYTFQNTGIKHKLLNALSNGGHCLTNDLMVLGTGLEHLCEIASNSKEIQESIKYLQGIEFSQNQHDERKKFLMEHFDMIKNAKRILTELT